jgi:hypothetical protein
MTFVGALEVSQPRPSRIPRRVLHPARNIEPPELGRAWGDGVRSNGGAHAGP